MTLLTRHKTKDSPYFQMKIIILIALQGVKFPEGGAAAPVTPPGYALGAKARELLGDMEANNEAIQKGLEAIATC